MNIEGIDYRLDDNAAANHFYGWHRGCSDVPGYALAGQNMFIPTENLDDAQWAMEGHTKWDGCSTVFFEDGMHVCGRRYAADVGAALLRAFDLSFDFMESRGVDCRLGRSS